MALNSTIESEPMSREPSQNQRSLTSDRGPALTALVLAFHFPPIGGGGVQRMVRFVRYAASAGTRLIVVTGPGRSQDRWAPQDDTLVDQVDGAVEIVRVQMPEPEPRGRIGRIGERALGLDSRFEDWWVRESVEVGLALGYRADVILGELVPYPTALAAAQLARELDIPWVADLQDPWALDEMWLYPTFAHRMRDRRRMRNLLRTAAAVVMNTPEAAPGS